MKTQLARWGNSLAIRIPKPVAQAARLKPGDPIELVTQGDGDVRICRKRRRRSIKQLVREITPENRHELIDWGEPVGKEVW